MQHSDGADLFALEHHGGRSLGEVHVVVTLLEEVVLVVGGANLGHEQAQGSMDDFERSAGVQLHDADLADVNGSGVSGCIQHSAVANLEDFLWDSLLLVGVEDLDKAWDHGGSHLLILWGLGVGQSDGFVDVYFRPQEVVVLLVAHQGAGQGLDVPRLGQLVAKKVSELVLGDVRTDRVRRWVGHLDVVEAVADSDLFGDVASVQDVCTDWRGSEVQAVGSGGFEGNKTHSHTCSFHLIDGQLNSEESADVLCLDFEVGGLKGWCDKSADGLVLIDDLDWLDGELLLTLAVLRELAGEDGQDDLALGELGAGDLDEDVFGVHGDLGGVRVDDGWQREHLSLLVIEHRVLIEVLDDVQVLLQLLVVAQRVKQLDAVHFLLLLQGAEDNVLRWMGLVGDWPLDGVIVMGTHGAEHSSSADVLVELVLEVDERVVGLDVKRYVAQNARRDILSNRGSLLLHDNLLQLLGLGHSESGQLLVVQVASQGHSDTFKAEEVVSIGWNLDLVNDRVFHVDISTCSVDPGHLHFLSSSDFHFESIIEAEVFEFFVGCTLGIRNY